jgi:hypothetical protein
MRGSSCTIARPDVLFLRADMDRTMESESTLFHLTPRGWETGAEPADRVETWRRTVSDDGRVSWRCEWVNLQKPSDERDALRKKYQASMT